MRVGRFAGGMRLYFPANPGRDSWLVMALGGDEELASEICAALVGDTLGCDIYVPGVDEDAASRRALMRTMIAAGAPVTEITSATGYRRRRVFYEKAAMRDERHRGWARARGPSPSFA